MKVFLLSDVDSPHTIKWATSLAKKGIDIVLFGLGKLTVSDYKNFDNIKIFTLNQRITRKEGNFEKIKYLIALPIIKRIIKEEKPDILHSHYATSYGFLGALTSFHPFIISVWGSDVFSFPKRSFLHKIILEFNLKKADKILSTSHIMAKETKIYTNKDVEVIPFGVDIEVFKPFNVEGFFDKNDIVIGTIKTLEPQYGVEYLIKAFKILNDRYPFLSLKFLIVGDGSLQEKLKKLCKDLGISDRTIFAGRVPYSEIPRYHNILTIFVALSNSESFGVSVVEAMACGKPVVVSDIGGLPEVVENGVTGFVVPPNNPQEAANAIEKLILDENLRKEMGQNARKRVEKFYNWNDNLNRMIQIYNELINS